MGCGQKQDGRSISQAASKAIAKHLGKHVCRSLVLRQQPQPQSQTDNAASRAFFRAVWHAEWACWCPSSPVSLRQIAIIREVLQDGSYEQARKMRGVVLYLRLFTVLSACDLEKLNIESRKRRLSGPEDKLSMCVWCGDKGYKLCQQPSVRFSLMKRLRHRAARNSWVALDIGAIVKGWHW